MAEEKLICDESLDLSLFVTNEGGIWSLRDIEKVRGWNNIEYGAGHREEYLQLDCR